MDSKEGNPAPPSYPGSLNSALLALQTRFNTAEKPPMMQWLVSSFWSKSQDCALELGEEFAPISCFMAISCFMVITQSQLL